jgi:hypothetical protein
MMAVLQIFWQWSDRAGGFDSGAIMTCRKIGGQLCLSLFIASVAHNGSLAQTVTFSASLEAGEFAPALRMAQAETNRDRRAARIEQIASRQAAIGERRAMIHTLAQQPGIPAGSGPAAIGNQNGPAAVVGGGGTQADFDALIELITSTIEPDTWTDVGGPGAIDEFSGGVFVDASGLLRRVAAPARNRHLALPRERPALPQPEPPQEL